MSCNLNLAENAVRETYMHDGLASSLPAMTGSSFSTRICRDLILLILPGISTYKPEVCAAIVFRIS